MTFPRNSNLVRTVICAFFLSIIANFAFADALQDWQQIIALDAGPKGDAQTREQARQLMIQNFDQQQRALQLFIAAYPADTHATEASMRLSHLLAVRSDLEGKPEYYTAATKILDKLETSPTTPPGKLPDVAYARITLLMHHTPNPDETQRQTLMAYVRQFQKDYPSDHRSANLLAEMASLYDSDPQTKREILDEALRNAGDDGVKQRINDDFKRLAMLGRPVELKFDSVQDEPIDVTKYRGKVVLVYFFANWAKPSILGLVEVKRIVDQFPKTKVQAIGISLDKSKEALAATMTKTGIDFPVYFDGKGWESPLARSLGINALPTAWVLDRSGNLRTLNAMNSTEAVITQLLQEK
ncbi:MAG: redoxin domain-containing protein [Chthoniobacteraceae bacterium]